MEKLAIILAGQLGRPVTDNTGLKGEYDIRLYWVTDTLRSGTPSPAGADGDEGPTITQAIQDQLGLRLEAKKGPVDCLIVDHIERAPTEN
jgi:uncharacterized protein (TIGR03435 family)